MPDKNQHFKPLEVGWVKGEYRGADHAVTSLWWSVKQLLTCLYKEKRTLIVLLSLRLDPPFWVIVELQNRVTKPNPLRSFFMKK